MSEHDPGELAAEIAKFQWYHTLDLGNGVVTPGMFDHRAIVHKYLMPESLAGMRCLDVGTMDGFWAFEMERRDAKEVIALDLEDPERLDWPASIRTGNEKRLDKTKEYRFNLVKSCLGSNVQRVLRSVYEIDADLGEFDLIFSGDLLVHLKDPVTAVEKMRSVCRGSTIICNPIAKLRFGSRRPIAVFDGIDEFQWWLLTAVGLERLIRAAGFARVEVGKAFELPATGGGPWKGLRGIMRGYV
jgi:tRNA (mo5U34)-methyltransferase